MITGPEFFLDALCLSIYSADPSTKALIVQAINLFKAEVAENAILDNSTTRIYIALMDDIVNSEIDLGSESEITTLLMKFSHSEVLAKDPHFLDNIKDIIKHRKAVGKRRIDFLQAKLRTWVVHSVAEKNIRKIFGKLSNCSNTTDPLKQEIIMNDVLEHSRTIVKAFEANSGVIDATVDFVDMSDKESVMRSLMSYNEKQHQNVVTTGLQALNRMFGPAGGPTRGELIAFAALSGHFKSGMLMAFARWMATLNTHTVPAGTKAAIVFISLENEINQNLIQWFREAYMTAFQAVPDGLTDAQIVDYVVQMYSKRGVTLLVYRKLGEFFGYEEYCALISDLQAKGYHLVASIIDYMTLMRLPQGEANQAKALQVLGQRLHEHANHNGITTITGLQFDTTAQQVAGNGQTYPIKRFDTSMLADCKGLIREFDFMAFLHIEENRLNGIRYLTCLWKKHRYVTPPPTEDRFFAYRFHKDFGICDDIMGRDMSVTDIYADVETTSPMDSAGKPITTALF